MNFIVLMTDGLRHDFANNPKYMPNLHRFFGEYGGYRFTNSYTTSNWTGACLLSLQTGMLPSNNGMWDITYGRHVSREEGAFKAVNCVEDDFLLAKMKKNGYNIKYIGDVKRWQFDIGSYAGIFDTNAFYEREYFQMKVWEQEKFDKPFILFSYDLDGGHDPWGVFRRDTKKDWEAWTEKYTAFYNHVKKNMNLARQVTFDENLAIRTNFVRHFPCMYPSYVLHALFRKQVLQYDAKLDEFFKWFVESGLYKDTALYFLADHGESLCEHSPAISGHAISLYDEEAKFPLFIYYPEGFDLHQKELCTITDNVSIVDIMPTILGKEALHDGINLFKRKKERCVFFEFTRYKLDEKIESEHRVLPSPNDYIRGVRFENYKLIYTRSITGKVVIRLYDFSKGSTECKETRVNNPEVEKFLLIVLKNTFNMDMENLQHVGRLEEVVKRLGKK